MIFTAFIGICVLLGNKPSSPQPKNPIDSYVIIRTETPQHIVSVDAEKGRCTVSISSSSSLTIR